MTSKQLLKTLKNMKEYCKTKECFGCEFQKNHECLIVSLAGELYQNPNRWDMDKIERIINE